MFAGMFDSPRIAPGAQDGGLAGAAHWVADVMTGTVATIVATLAVAALGLAMLQGRLSVRDAARAVLGCFILFGAPYMARSLAGMAPSADIPAVVYSAPTPPPPVVPPTPQADRDPYAGASVPMQ